MAHSVVRPALLVALALGLSGSTDAARAGSTGAPGVTQGRSGSQAAPAPSLLDTARIEVTRGRAILVGSEHDARTVRRGEAVDTVGRSQLEVSAGSELRVRFRDTMTVVAYGPCSFEWGASGSGIGLTFHLLSWADIETRGGTHTVELPADWRATVRRGSLHLRGLSHGPSELRCDAGVPVQLEWRGDRTAVRPPLQVYPGSSVRLDAPVHGPVELPGPTGKAGAWEAPLTAGEDARTWPYRAAADSPAQVRERAALAGETQDLSELPGGPNPSRSRIRSYESDGSSSVRPLRRARDRERSTYAQIPVTPSAPRVEFESRPLDRSDPQDGSTWLPRRPETAPIERPSTSVRSVAPSAPEPPAAVRPAVEPPSGQADPSPQARADQQQGAATEHGGSDAPFLRSQWRGLLRASLNGVDEIAAERGSGVEVRILGSGRTKVFVGWASPSPRWCFTPTTDYLMKPGSVAVFEPDGSMRMSLGQVEANEPLEGRPSFSRLRSTTGLASPNSPKE